MGLLIVDVDENCSNPGATRWARFYQWFLPRGRTAWWRRMRWGRAGVVAGPALYVGGVTAAFGFVRWMVPTEEVRYLDFLAPWRWERYHHSRAGNQFEMARRSLREGKPAEAWLLARTALHRVPTHRDGRLVCAELQVGLGDFNAARDLLVEGLRYHAADPAYLKPVFAFLLRQQEDERVVELAERLRPGAGPATDAARVLGLAAATACWWRGDYDRAEDWLGAVPRLASAREGRLLAAKMEWDRGYRELALVELRQLAAEWPRDAEVHRELIGRLRQHGARDEARRRSLAFQLACPELPGPRIALMFAYHEAGDAGRVASEAEALQRDFAGDGAALLALAEFAANRGDVPLARRLAQDAAEHRLAPAAFALLAIEAMVVARDFRGAIEAIGEQRKQPAGAGAFAGGLLDSLQAVASVGVGEPGEAEMYLGQFLKAPNLRVENLLAVANRLIEFDATGPARRTLLRAMEVDSRNQAALTRLVEIEVMLNAGGELAAHVRRLIEMRRPAPDVLRIAQHKLGSDLFLFSPECMAAADAAQAALAKAAAGRGRR